VPTFETFERHFKGWRIVAREPLVVDVYSDQIYPDAETIVAARAPGVTPWHTLALGIRGERSGELAFSSDKADRNGSTWLSLASGPSMAILDRHRREAAEAGWRPFERVLGSYVDAEAARSRYAALGDWRDDHGHYWVSDGPFFLDEVHPVAGTLELERYADFPDAGDKWLDRADAAIPELAIEGPMTLSGDQSARFDVRVSAEGQPYPRAAVAGLDYMLLDGEGRIVERGQARFAGDGDWRIELGRDTVAALTSGAHRLEVTLRSERVALPRFASHVFAAVGADAAGSEP
jgi:peptide/nickel transport system substrate-binding protein